MIRTLSGNNAYMLKTRLAEIVGKFKAEYGDLAVERLDGEEIDSQSIIDSIQSLPFLAERKLVIVRNASKSKQVSEQIEQIISATANAVDLIFYEPSPDKRTVFYKTLKAKSQFEEFTELDNLGLVKWLVKEVNRQGGHIGQAEASYLVDRLGSDQLLLANELDKLITYNPGVTRENIDLLTEKNPQSKVFDLIDAAFAGNKARALELYEEQRAQKVEPQAILAMLAWQLNILAIAKYGADKPAADIAKDLGVSPFPINKAAALARKIDQKSLKNLVTQAEKIDRLSKTKPIDLDEALKTYIATIS